MRSQKGRRWLYLIFLINLAVGLAIFVMGVSWWRLTHLAEVQPGSPIVVDTNGVARQSGSLVGLMQPGSPSYLKLSFANASDPQDFFLTVQFPHFQADSTQPAPVTFKSIQGTLGMQAYWSAADTVMLSVSQVLPESHTSATIALAYGKPTLEARIATWAQDLSIPLAILIAGVLLLLDILYVIILLHRHRQENVPIQTSPPPGITPLELAIIMHGNIRAVDVLAILYGLASRGFLQIISHDEEVILLRTDKQGLTPYEDALLGVVCHTGAATHLKELLQTINKSLFSKTISLLHVAAYANLKDQGYVEEDIRYVHLRYKTVGIILQLVSLVGVITCYFLFGSAATGLLIPGLAVYLGGYLIYRVGYHIVPLTSSGLQLARACLGFRHYLRQADLIDSPAGGMELFYQYLPYALVLSEVEAWFARFAHQGFLIPNWFTAEEQDFEPLDFIKHIQQVIGMFADTFIKLKDPNVD